MNVGRAPRAIAAAVVLALAAAPAAAQERDVVVSAAASLTDVLTELAAVWEARTGGRAVLNLAGSNTLARQIAAGARVDLFLSADETQMDAVAPWLEPGTRVDLLANQLAVAVPDDRPVTLRAIGELAGEAFRRIAVGDPAAVPAGVYARRYLESAGLWARLEPRLIPTGSVRLALSAVESGAADAAIVYRTDLAVASRAALAFVVPPDEGPRIVYPAAVVRGGANTAGARRFLAFLQSPDAAAVFARAGFRPPGAAGP